MSSIFDVPGLKRSYSPELKWFRTGQGRLPAINIHLGQARVSRLSQLNDAFNAFANLKVLTGDARSLYSGAAGVCFVLDNSEHAY